MSKTDDVYMLLRQRITSGTYTPGYRLVMDAISRELGMSPIPVREAIRRLEAEGLVQHHPNVGAEVTGVDDRQYTEILAVLARMEGWGTALAGPRMTDEDIAQLTAIVHEMSRALDMSHLERYAELNRQFHARIRQHCPNRFLADVVDRTWSQLERARRNIFLLVPGRARESLHDHYHIVQSLREHAPPEVLETLVEAHQLRTLEAYLQHQGESAAVPRSATNEAPMRGLPGSAYSGLKQSFSGES